MPVQLGRPLRLYAGSFPFFVPSSPTSVQAFPGAASALVSWTAPTIDGGSPITNYVVTASPGGAQATTTGGTVTTVNGLTNGTAYTFTVKAYNLVGASPPSAASAAVTPAAIPDAPTGVSAVPSNAQATVSWTASNSEGSPVTGYRVLSSPGGFTATTTGTTTATVTGLTNGTAYTFTVTATNSLGTSASSTASTAVTPTTLPGAPTSVVATPQDQQANVSWSAPASNGGSAITGYTVTSSPGSKTATTTGALSATVSGLTNGTTYTFTVTATNAVGMGSPSAASNAVIPVGSTGGWIYGLNTTYKPVATTSGVPSGTVLVTHTGSYSISTSGTFITGMDITGGVGVQASNFTLASSRVRGQATTAGASSCVEMRYTQVVNALIEDCEIAPDLVAVFLNCVMGHDYTLQRCNLHAGTDTIRSSQSNLNGASNAATNVAVLGCYIWGLAGWLNDPSQGNGPSHSDGHQDEGGNNVLVKGNNFQCFIDGTLGNGSATTANWNGGNHPVAGSTATNSCMQLNHNTGATTSGFVVTQNWMNGGYIAINSNLSATDKLDAITSNLFGHGTTSGVQINITTPLTITAKTGNRFEDNIGTIRTNGF